MRASILLFIPTLFFSAISWAVEPASEKEIPMVLVCSSNQQEYFRWGMVGTHAFSQNSPGVLTGALHEAAILREGKLITLEDKFGDNPEATYVKNDPVAANSDVTTVTIEPTGAGEVTNVTLELGTNISKIFGEVADELQGSHVIDTGMVTVKYADGKSSTAEMACTFVIRTRD